MDWIKEHLKEIVWFGLVWIVGFIVAGIDSANGWLTGF